MPIFKEPDDLPALDESGLDEYGVWVKLGSDGVDLDKVNLLDDIEEIEVKDETYLDSPLSLDLEDELTIADPMLDGISSADFSEGQESELMSNQEKKYDLLANDSQNSGLSQDSDIDLSGTDDLSDLSELLLSIDEEVNEDETIYLEDDELSLDLDSGSEDILLEPEGTDAGNGDDYSGDIEIPGLDDDLSVLSFDDDSGVDFSALDLEEDSQQDSLSALDKPQKAEIELHNIEEVGLDEFIDINEDETSPSLSNEEEDELLLINEPDSEEGIIIDESLPSLDDDFETSEVELGTFKNDSDFDASEFMLDSQEDMINVTAAEDDLEVRVGGFDDVAAVERAFSQEEAPSRKESVAETVTERHKESVLGNRVEHDSLRSIEEELHAIRSELTDLRIELKRLRTKDSTSNNVADLAEQKPLDSLSVDPIEQHQLESNETETNNLSDDETIGGFFEDDEDETIALTGDELDNILNSAEFTEEEGEPTQIDESEELVSATSASDDLPILAFEDQAENDAFSPIEEISLQEISDEDSNQELGDFDLGPSNEEVFGVEDSSLLDEDDHEEVRSMAQLDIEKELADIEDLQDDEDDLEVFSSDEIADISIDIPEDLDLNPNEDNWETIESLDNLPEQAQNSVESPNDTMNNTANDSASLPSEPVTHSLKQEIKAVLSYMDRLLESLPEEKIEEFARSEHFEVYKKLFEELGI